MQLLRFWRATGLSAVCRTYLDFTFYKQTPCSLSGRCHPWCPHWQHSEYRQRCRSCLFPSALSRGAASAVAMGSWTYFRCRGTARYVLAYTASPGGNHPRSGGTHACAGCCCLGRPQGLARSLAASPRSQWETGGQPTPLATARGEGPARRKPNPPGWRNRRWTCSTERGERYRLAALKMPEKTYFRTKQRGQVKHLGVLSARVRQWWWGSLSPRAFSSLEVLS